MYTVITSQTGCHHLITAMLKSAKVYLTGCDEILNAYNYFFRHRLRQDHGVIMHDGVLKAKNDLVLFMDQDLIVTSKAVEEKLLGVMEMRPDVLACGFMEYNFEGDFLPLPPALTMRKSIYLKMVADDPNVVFAGGNPMYSLFKKAKDTGVKFIVLPELQHSIFHLGEACLQVYPHLFPYWEKSYDAWREINGGPPFEDIVVDDGMDFNDLDALNYRILTDLDTAIRERKPFSTMRLGDLGLRYLAGYLDKSSDFTHVGAHHPDIAVPNDEIGSKMVEELIVGMNEADWIDHGEYYKGYMGNLYGWRSLIQRTEEYYQKAGITNRNYCSSMQGYLAFVKDFQVSMYDIMKCRRVLYVGPYNGLREIQSRRDLQCTELGFYELSLGDHMTRYNVMQRFMETFKPDYWDLVLVTGSLYGRIIIGRIRRAGGRAFDLGQAVSFNPNNIFETVVKAVDNKTFYELVPPKEKKDLTL